MPKYLRQGTGHQAPAATAPADPNAPVMSFETKEHDFGTIARMIMAPIYLCLPIPVRNLLLLKKLMVLAVVLYQDGPTIRLTPAQKDTIKVTYDTHRIGVFTKTVTITSNAKETPVILSIKGKVLSKDNYPAFPTNNNSNTGVPYTNHWDNSSPTN